MDEDGENAVVVLPGAVLAFLAGGSAIARSEWRVRGMSCREKRKNAESRGSERLYIRHSRAASDSHARIAA